KGFCIKPDLRICKEKGYLLQYLDDHFAELENAMLPAYEPRSVRAAQERSGTIYASIKML
ncbi:MAG: hypothetical protein IJT77_14900, partial [Clostridia bacterium]|nr:hypothetical protein [Clostridia bacterium]